MLLFFNGSTLLVNTYMCQLSNLYSSNKLQPFYQIQKLNYLFFFI